MKLRDKKTGEVYNVTGLIECNGETFLLSKQTLAELNERFEDYGKKPLIQGEKYIKLFKKWCEVCDVFIIRSKDEKCFKYIRETDRIVKYEKDVFENVIDNRRSYGISFNEFSALRKLEDGKMYSYYDLVGKEDE